MDEHADGTGEPCERAGMATEHEVVQPLELRSPRTVQQQQRDELHGAAVRGDGKILQHAFLRVGRGRRGRVTTHCQVGHARLPRGSLR